MESRLVVALGAVDALGHQPAILTRWGGSPRAPDIALEERRRKVLEGQLEKKEEIVECILSKT